MARAGVHSCGHVDPARHRRRGRTIVTAVPDSLARVRNDRPVKLDPGGGDPAARTPLDSPLATEIAGRDGIETFGARFSALRG